MTARTLRQWARTGGAAACTGCAATSRLRAPGGGPRRVTTAMLAWDAAPSRTPLFLRPPLALS